MAATALVRIPIDAIRITALRTSWRTEARIAPGAMTELIRCVSARGWLQAVTVRKQGEQYELIDGERRLMTAKNAGETDIDAVVIEADDATAAAVCLMANLGGKRLRGIEMARLCAMVRDALTAAGAPSTQQAVGEWVGLKQPTVNQYLTIAEGFTPEILSSVGVTVDDLVRHPAHVLAESAKRSVDDRRTWLEAVRDRSGAPRPRSASAGSQQASKRIRQLKDACLQQQPGFTPTSEAITVMVELLGVIRILGAQVVAAGLASASAKVRDTVTTVRDYRSPIIQSIEQARVALSLVRQGWKRLRRATARSAKRVGRRVASYLRRNVLTAARMCRAGEYRPALGGNDPSPSAERGDALHGAREPPR
jgi:ParB/RepB/Spo0J family partition protein